MTGERLLDACGLEAPEPLQQTLAAVDNLMPGEYLRLLIGRDPVLLYPLLTVQGFSYQRHSTAHGFEIIIWRQGDKTAESILAGSGYGD